MRAPPAAGWLLDAAEATRRLHPIDRALAVIAAADQALEDPSFEDPALEDPASLPLPERDRRLFELRRAAFGDAMPCVVDCPRCGSTMEFDLSAAEVAAGLCDDHPPEIVEVADWAIEIRALDSRDLARAAGCGDPERAISSLAASAATVVRRPDASGPDDDPPAEALAMAQTRLADREAAAEVALDLACEACGARWTEGFDIGAHLCAEINVAAQRLIGEVATLAARFGWSEAEILALPAARRRAYLVEALR